MSDKRSFTKKITESDAFLNLPLSSQCLYFHLNMNTDDDGFVNNPKKIMRMIGASEDDMKLLISKAFILVFESGVIVIKHFRMHNTLKNDRYHPTNYQEEFQMIGLKSNNAYTWRQVGNRLETTCIQNGDESETEHNLTKHNLTKHNNIRHEYGQYKNVLLSDDELEKLRSEFYDWEERIERVSEYCASKGKRYSNYLATIRNWARKESSTKKEEDHLPIYDTSKNKQMSPEEEAELLAIMKERKE